MKKVGKTTRPFRYDINKIPYNYANKMEIRFSEHALLGMEKLYTVSKNKTRS